MLKISAMMLIVVAYSKRFWAMSRRLIISVMGRQELDAKLNLHLFQSIAAAAARIIIFERTSRQRRDACIKIAQVYHVREFLTGKLLATFLDMITLCVLLPFLFYLNSTLACIVAGCAVLILLIIIAYLRPLRELYSRVTAAADVEIYDAWRNHRRHQDFGKAARAGGAAAQGDLG